jgi:hypothetical protein
VSTPWLIGLSLFWLVGIPGLVRDWRPGPIDRASRTKRLPRELMPAWVALRRTALTNEATLMGIIVGTAFPGQILLAAAVFALSFVATGTIMLWNQPRLLVPPKMRDQLGLAAS